MFRVMLKDVEEEREEKNRDLLKEVSRRLVKSLDDIADHSRIDLLLRQRK